MLHEILLSFQVKIFHVLTTYFIFFYDFNVCILIYNSFIFNKYNYVARKFKTYFFNYQIKCEFFNLINVSVRSINTVSSLYQDIHRNQFFHHCLYLSINYYMLIKNK